MDVEWSSGRDRKTAVAYTLYSSAATQLRFYARYTQRAFLIATTIRKQTHRASACT